MAYRVTLIPGDGTGPELIAAARQVLEATGVEFDGGSSTGGWCRCDGKVRHALWRNSAALPEAVLNSIRANKVALKGPITTPVGTGFRSVNVALRKVLDLYANLRPVRTMEGSPVCHEGLDLVVVRGQYRRAVCWH